jgi:hypothetical protein
MRQKEAISHDDLKKHFEEQLELLELNCNFFDEGKDIVAKTIATYVRILVHDTKKSRSLLGLLDIKNEKFFDSSSIMRDEKRLNIQRIGSFCGLVGIAVGGNGKSYIPYLDDYPNENIFGFVSFEDYWTRTIFIDQMGNSFSRKDIILTVANQDGGAHVDPKIDKDYKNLTRSNALGHHISSDGINWVAPLGAERAAIRQIGHEILRTFKKNYTHKKMISSGQGFIMGGMGSWITTQVDDMPKLKKDTMQKVGRNDKCPCGSNVKFKRCHGK